MSTDPELLEQWLDRIADRFSATELIEALEDAGLVDVYVIVALFSEELVEVKERLEV